MGTTIAVDQDLLIDVLNHAQVLQELHRGPVKRGDLEGRLGVSSATCYRYTNWLGEMEMVSETDDELALTTLGETVSEEVAAFETDVLETLQPTEMDAPLVDVVRFAPALDALSAEPLDRRDLEKRLDVSKSTGYRITRSLETHGLATKSGRAYTLTPVGTSILEAVSTFRTNVRIAVRLGPVLETLRERGPTVTLEAFADATVTTTTQGYTHSPARRFMELLGRTNTLRGMDIGVVCPFDMYDTDHAIEEVESEEIHRPEPVAGVLAEYPERALELCARESVTTYLHDGLWYSLAIFDDRVGIGVREPEGERIRAFVDTDSEEVRRWAEHVYESYRNESIHLPNLTPTGIRQAMEKHELEKPRADGR